MTSASCPSAGPGSPLYVPDGAAYIAATAVLPEDRGAGTGAALVTRRSPGPGITAIARRACTTRRRIRISTSFWTGIGFRPVMAHLRRRLDERILDNRPRT